MKINKNVIQNKRYKIISLTVSLILLLVVVREFATPYRLSGDCMEPAIMDGKLYFLNKISSYLRHYQIGDIIVFKHEGKDWISRIVAVENNTIQITEGHVIVNGVALDERGIRRHWSGWKQGVYAIDKPLQVPANHVFVLSDNLSANHDDSRVFGPISNSSIVGLIW